MSLEGLLINRNPTDSSTDVIDGGKGRTIVCFSQCSVSWLHFRIFFAQIRKVAPLGPTNE